MSIGWLPIKVSTAHVVGLVVGMCGAGLCSIGRLPIRVATAELHVGIFADKGCHRSCGEVGRGHVRGGADVDRSVADKGCHRSCGWVGRGHAWGGADVDRSVADKGCHTRAPCGHICR